GVALGFVAVFATMAAQTGRWDAFFLTQAGYGYGLSDPFGTLFTHLAPLVKEAPFSVRWATALQTLWVTAFVGFLGVTALRERRDPVRWMLVAYVIAFWAFPLVLGGSLSLYRAEALLLPGAILLRAAPARVLVGFTVVAVALSWPIAAAFLTGEIV